MLYPLKFKPVYKNILWGGRNIEKHYKRCLPEGSIGESWEVCCHDEGMSIIENGKHQNQGLDFLINQYEDKLLGTDIFENHKNTFPLLIKLIDANDKLSVQVHPDDKYARMNNEGSGKTEMWYVIDAKPGARLIYGLKKNVKKEDLKNALEKRNVEPILNEVAVKPGDIFYIPAGMVHAILEGILIAEIQQNSNTTYRLYDWNRVDKNGQLRELHIERALDVICFSENEDLNVLSSYECSSYCMKTLVNSPYFSVEEMDIKKSYSNTTDGSKFYIYMSLSGRGIINYFDGYIEINAGDTVLIPASLGFYEIKGNLKALKIYI
ncbi:putative mannose-6-phosphate isomerase GmuF [Oxobacter pfennigii]|uniref:Phosphohexomutase n=1 Tax=Oxobacter pfennigii TaxID=36849 RepID=A0A0P8WJB8_9CLOT|nr:type I phosphomannose isomerase catalytic subunit [Oxobacter pfennigii]KPU42238.1 putative mannose-6-phosphate isomerase GmuF [Oxobacter pfennigii]